MRNRRNGTHKVVLRMLPVFLAAVLLGGCGNSNLRSGSFSYTPGEDMDLSDAAESVAENIAEWVDRISDGIGVLTEDGEDSGSEGDSDNYSITRIPDAFLPETESGADGTVQPEADSSDAFRMTEILREIQDTVSGGTTPEVLDYDTVYNTLLKGIENRETVITGLGSERTLVEQAANDIWLTHPELFWYSKACRITSTTVAGTVITISMEPEYAYSEAETAERKAVMDATAETFRTESNGRSDYETVKAAYLRVTEQADYSFDENDQDASCVLVDGAGVCGAYARAVQFLLQSADMEALYLYGTLADGTQHAWNAVCVEGEWYHVDATWGDPVSEDGSGIGENMDYLCLTDEEIYIGRTLAENLTAPVCTATAWNYYRAEGWYLETYSEDAYTALYERALTENRTAVSVRFATQEAYEAAVDALITGEGLFSVLARAEADLGVSLSHCVQYAENEELHILDVKLT